MQKILSRDLYKVLSDKELQKLHEHMEHNKDLMKYEFIHRDEKVLVRENGNYKMIFYHDGTCIRVSADDTFIPDMPECIDCTITYKCNGVCPFCYMGCTTSGEHAALLSGHNKELLEQIPAGTEFAINGNDLSHPELEEFLRFMKEHDVIVNITVQQKHFIEYFVKLKSWVHNGLVHGIGVSFNGTYSSELIDKLKSPEIVVHIINGIATGEDIEFLADNNLNLLILGYKFDQGRSTEYYETNKDTIDTNMKNLAKYVEALYFRGMTGFRTISLDTLAVKQMAVKDWMTPAQYEAIYYGDEGQYTFFLDLVKGQFAVSSTHDTTYNCENMSIKEMFDKVRSISNGQEGNY